MNIETKRINKTLIYSWATIIAILLVAYGVEVIKGERTMQYLCTFGVVMIVPYLLCALLFRQKPDRERFGYIVVAGYSCMYAFVMFTGATQMVSTYILPLLSFLVLYHKPFLVAYTYLISIAINIASLVYNLSRNSITVSNSKDIEITFACITVAFAGVFVSAQLYDMIYKTNERYNKELADKNQRIQDMAIQTISTIANAIDAKDEYTRGHSKRVADYSVAIAEEIGMAQDQIRELRSIALLHDIGKIGVPDSVLNKPGRLTNDEYELMKQHTVTGAEILKDIDMFPGVDVGAKYHHERYDGKGYPEKLQGQEIPEIARIIAVADAFDAMTSNRVYRKQLDMDKVTAELEKCKGSQFDPQMADALLKLLAEKRLTPIAQENVETEDISEVGKILSRVIEKDEEKIKDTSKDTALYDELTGLYNRSYGENVIRESVSQNKGTILAVDIDHFRRVNGQAGFLFGDIFLRSVADCIQEIQEDKLAARYGGDEFVVFIPNITSREKIDAICEEMIGQVRTRKEQLHENVSLTVSIGVRICEGMKNEYQDMYLDADRALYMAKRQGGNCYMYFEKDTTELNEKENVDLLRVKDTLCHPEKYDAYIAEAPEFQKAYEILKQFMDGGNTPLQLILFTVKPNDGVTVSPDTQNSVMDYLEKAIVRSIKGKDCTFRYSSTQRMILLANSGEEGADAVSRHIIKEFYKLYDKKEINITYSMIDVE